MSRLAARRVRSSCAVREREVHDRSLDVGNAHGLNVAQYGNHEPTDFPDSHPDILEPVVDDVSAVDPGIHCRDFTQGLYGSFHKE